MSLNLRKKVFLILILLTTVPLLILGTTATYIATNSLEKKITFLANKTLENLTGYMSKDIQNYTSLVFYCSRNTEIINALLEENSRNRSKIFFAIKSAITKSDVIRQVNYPFQYIVVSRNQTAYTSFSHQEMGGISGWQPAFIDQAWYSELRSSPLNILKIVVSSNELFANGDDQIYFASNIIYNFDSIGTVLIGIDEYVFGRLLMNSKITNGSSIFIFDGKRELMVEGENNPLSAREDSGGLERLIDGLPQDKADFPVHAVVDDHRYMVTAKNIEFRENNVSWLVLMLTPESEILRDVNKISYVNFSLLALCLVAIVILNIVVNRVIVNPVLLLNRLTTEVSQGNLSVRAQELRNDEIGRLGHGFNEMIESLNSYIGSVERQEQEKRKLEIRILQNQINPHFLHNVLNTIKWMAELKQAHGISRALVSTSRLLDYNFSSTNNIVKVKEELAYTDEYVHLQKLRYQNKFSFEYSIEPEVLESPILKCTFQPILENSIVHGFKGKRGKCTIYLEGYRSDAHTIITIADNGVGMDRETLQHLFDGDPVQRSGQLEGIALTNIRQRIRLHFGDPYGVTVSSNPGKGTAVTLFLPGINGQTTNGQTTKGDKSI